MEPRFTIIAGSGKTSRANIEALMEDHYYACKNKFDLTLVLPCKSNLSEAQIWAAQHAHDYGINMVVLTETEWESAPEGLPAGVNITLQTRPLEYLEGVSNVEMFLLPKEETAVTQMFLDLCAKMDIPVFDLTNGLHSLSTAPKKPVEAPKSEPQPQPVNTDTLIQDMAEKFAKAFIEQVRKSLS